MSQFTSGFWDAYIALLTLASVIGCAAFLKHQSVRRVVEPETTGHRWDEDLEEYNNPLPRWWAWLFYLTIAFSLVYLALYPGLGSYAGLLGWSQDKQLAEETQAAEARLAPLYQKYAAMPVEALARESAALGIGGKLFLNHCAGCHASDARGSPGFPNLADGDWLWGGTPEAIRISIAEGRTGVMPPFGPLLGEAGVREMVQYVLSLSGQPHEAAAAARAKDKFAQLCAACHGAEGKGNAQLGAPDLTDKIWLHGGSATAIAEQIAKGRQNVMPAHKDFLSPVKVHLLTAYVYSLSASPPAAPSR